MNRNLVMTLFVLWSSTLLYFSVIHYLPLLDIPLPITILIDVAFIAYFCWYYFRTVGVPSFVLNRKDILPLLKSSGLFAFLFIVTIPFTFSSVSNIVSKEFEIGFGMISQDTLLSLFKESYLYLIAGLLIAPITEEIVYRGLFQEYLTRKKHTHWIVILIPAVLFTVMHFRLTNIHLLFVNGLLYGYVYYKYRKISINIVCHALWNLLDTAFRAERQFDFLFFFVWALALVAFCLLFRSAQQDDRATVNDEPVPVGRDEITKGLEESKENQKKPKKRCDLT